MRYESPINPILEYIYIYNLILLSLINSLPKLYIYPNKIDPITLNIYTLPYNIRYIT